MSKNQDIFRRHGAIALLGLAALLASAGCNNDGGATETPAATTPATDPALAGPEGGGMAPGPGAFPGGAPNAGAPMGSPGAGAAGAFKSGTRSNSWSTAPKSVQLAAAGAAQGGFGGGMPGAGGGGPTGGSKPAPIQEGKREAKYRTDPFVSFFKEVVELPAAYTLALPRRLAKIPVYTPPSDETIPVDIRLGPLPPVPRRVAGVLYNGAITAILETGITPDSEVVVIQPGASVRSGVPGIPALTVESITMDRLILRAVDGRTVEVKLSGLPPSVAAALGGQFGNQGGGFGGPPGGFGGPPGGFGGPPGGFGGPGGRGGGSGSGAPLQ